MAELVTIPISFFEFVVEYEKPKFQLWLDRASIVQAIFDALQPWQPRIDDTDFVNTGKVSEQGFTIKLPLKRVLFFFGPASFKFTRENVNWQSVEETIAILDCALLALGRIGGVTLGTRNTAIAIHVQPKSLPSIELLNPLIPSRLVALDTEAVKTMATVVKWATHKVTIDGSGLVANAIFIRLEREFPPNATYAEMADQLRQDEEDLFKVLEIEEDRP